MKTKTRNSKLKNKAAYASDILRKREIALEKLIKSNKKTVKTSNSDDNKQNKTNKRIAGISYLRFAVLALISLTLITTMFASMTLSWFMMTVEGPATQLTTGHVDLTFKSYKSNNDLDKYLDTEVTGTDSNQLATLLQKNVGMFADANVYDDVYFIIEKKEGSIPLETYLSFTIEGINNSAIVSDYIGGFMFKLENITEKFITCNEILTSVFDVVGSTALDSSSVYENKLHDYINRYPENESISRSLSFISSDVGTNTASDLVNGDVCVYRLTTYLTDEARSSGRYQNIAFTIRVNLKAAQEGALTGGTATNHPVASMSDFNTAISTLTPGDVVTLNDNFTYNGDLIINVPVTLILNGYTLTVRGNFICTSSYSGAFEIDTSDGGSILVKKNIVGGNFDIDASGCSFLIKGAASVSNVDIAIEGSFKADCSAPAASDYSDVSSDTGLTIDGARICSIESGAVVQSNLKDVTVKENTRVNVTAGTVFGKIAADEGVEVFSLVNYGEIHEIDLTKMSMLQVANSTYSNDLHMPQIFIDNYGTISSKIHLPNDARKFSTSTSQGNTRIIREFDAYDDGVDGSDFYFDQHIESIAVNVIDVNDDGSYLKIYYTDFTVPNITLEQIFEGNGTDAYPGYFAESGRSKSSVVNIKIITGSTKNMTASDFLYLRTNLTSITTLDLSDASCTDNEIPANALENMTLLSALTLPTDAVSIGTAFVNGTQVYDLYLPEGISSVGSSALLGVRYIHPQYTGSALENLVSNGDLRYVFAPSATMLDNYRSMYSSFLPYIFSEASLSRDGNFFFRKTSSITMDLAVWVGTSGDAANANYSYMNANGNDYYISAFDDYSFYGKLVSNAVDLTFSTQLSSIGEYAFEGCTAINSIYLKSSKLSKIGFEAFKNCSSLKTVYIDGVEGQSAQLMDTPSADPNISNSVFYGCTSLSNMTLSHISGCSANLLRPDGTTLLPLVTLRLISMGDVDDYAFTTITGDVFAGSATLKELYVENVQNIGNYAFNKCTTLQSVYLKNVDSIGTKSFMDCDELRIVSAPELTKAGLSSFEACTALEVISMPNLTTLTGSSNSAKTFYNCPNIKILNIGIPKLQNGTSAPDFFTSNTTLNNLKLWLMHTENYSGTSLPSGYTNAAVPSTAMIFVSSSSNSLYQNIQTAFDENTYKVVFSIGSVSAADMNWASATGDKTIVWRVEPDNQNSKRLSDFGLGDYLYSTTGSVSTVWKCIIEQVKGTENMPDMAPVGGTTTIAAYACQYLDAIESTSKTVAVEDRPVMVMPLSVTRIEYKAFSECKLYGVEGEGVLFLGERSFYSSPYLRWAKFIRCKQFGRSRIGTTTKTEAYTFSECPLFSVLEIGVIDESLRIKPGTTNTIGGNTIGVLWGDSNFRLLIFHTETVNENRTFSKEWIACAFTDNDYHDMSPYPTFKILVSETSGNNSNYYNGSWDSTYVVPFLNSTGSVMADKYIFAAENTDGISRYVIGNGWYLSDIGYGDYLCTETNGGEAAQLIAAFFPQNRISRDKYITPSYTIDGLPITSIASYAYGKIAFDLACELTIADTTTSIGDYAFVGYNTTLGSFNKNIVRVNLNNVSTVGSNVFQNVTTIETVEAGSNITNLGTNTFYHCSANLESVTLNTSNQVANTSIFNVSALPNTFKLKVYSDAYINYYKYPNKATTWFGISTDTGLGDSVPHFETLGNVYPDNGFLFYYDTYEDNLTGITGYRITSIENTLGSQTVLTIPSGISAVANSPVLPVLSIGDAAFSQLSTSTTITSIVLPKYLQTIDCRVFDSLWSTMAAYSISTTYPASEPVSLTNVPLQCNFTVVDGILYSEDMKVLVSCPTAISSNLTIGTGTALESIGSYAFKNTHSCNITINSIYNFIIISEKAFNGNGITQNTTQTVTINCGAYIMNNAFYNMTSLTSLNLTSDSDYSMFLGGSTIVSPHASFKIVVPVSAYQYYGNSTIYDSFAASKISIPE